MILYADDTCSFSKLTEDFLKANKIKYQKISIFDENCPQNVKESKIRPIIRVKDKWLYGPSYHELAEIYNIPIQEQVYYFDYAATTPLSSYINDAMYYINKNFHGNPSSQHQYGQRAYTILENSRKNIAKLLSCSPKEVIFTGSGSEANNLAIKGLAQANKDKGNHIIISCIEHKSILKACDSLKKQGFRISILPVDYCGNIDYECLRNEICDETILVSVMIANNEIGVIQDYKKIRKITREKGVLFHADAVQALGHLNLNFSSLDLDAMTISAHKIYGPKGIGALLCKENVPLSPLISGGAQENNYRAGTENIALIYGFDLALEERISKIDIVEEHLNKIKAYLISRIRSNIPNSIINSSEFNSLNNIVSITFNACEIYDIAALLDFYGICVSRGSACNLNEYSHVLKSIGLSEKNAKNTIRVSLGYNTTFSDVDYLVNTLTKVIKNFSI